MTQRSTKGASKQRRDAINDKIAQIRDLLPASEGIRNRLSQLQVMSLASAYIAKSNFFSQYESSGFEDRTSGLNELFDFTQGLPGFLLVVNTEGKILYISEAIADYLGHSAVDSMTQVDTVYDLIDERDQGVLRDALRSAPAMQPDWSGDFFSGQVKEADTVAFSCRMSTAPRGIRSLGISSASKTPGFGQFKMMQVHGRFMHPRSGSGYGAGYATIQQLQQPQRPVLVAFCRPHLSLSDCMTSHDDNSSTGFDTMIFRTVHRLDMKFVQLEPNGECHLGYKQTEIYGKSWYELIHWDDIEEAKRMHLELTQAYSSGEVSAWRSLCMRVQSQCGTFHWLHVIMRICENDDGTSSTTGAGQPLVVCINHVITENEAIAIRERDIWDDMEMLSARGDFIPDGRFLDGFCQNAQSPVSGFCMTSSPDSLAFSGTSRVDVLRGLKRKLESGSQAVGSVPHKRSRQNFDEVIFSIPSPPSSSSWPSSCGSLDGIQQFSQNDTSSSSSFSTHVMTAPAGTSSYMKKNVLFSADLIKVDVDENNAMVPDLYLTPSQSPASSTASYSPSLPNLTTGKVDVSRQQRPFSQTITSDLLLDDCSFFDQIHQGKMLAAQPVPVPVPVPVSVSKAVDLPVLDEKAVESYLDCLSCCPSAFPLTISGLQSSFRDVAHTTEGPDLMTSSAGEFVSEDMLKNLLNLGHDFLQETMASWESNGHCGQTCGGIPTVVTNYCMADNYIF